MNNPKITSSEEYLNLAGHEYHGKVWQLETSFFAATISELGATLRELYLPDRDNRREDVLVGYSDLNQYLRQDCYFGTTIGRCANRIANAEFELDGTLYKLDTNNGQNHLHGGDSGYNNKHFDSALSPDGNAIEFTLYDRATSYPGNVKLKLIYSCPDGQSLHISYQAECDDKTLINLTNHAYFNLNPSSQNASEHKLQVKANNYLPVHSTLIPNGEICPVKDSYFDFLEYRIIADQLNADDEQQKLVGGGFDHNFVLLDNREPAAQLFSPQTGRSLALYTDLPGLQVYTANFPPAGLDKRGREFAVHDAVCLEPQYFPNAINQSNFTAPIFTPEHSYNHFISYKFSVLD